MKMVVELNAEFFIDDMDYDQTTTFQRIAYTEMLRKRLAAVFEDIAEENSSIDAKVCFVKDEQSVKNPDM
ncbi:hypothetical protein BK131_04505 [Paenibacillus amylolyticus]|uniref:Uncharacterized protein n=1 Tax=Paenibacillus amylolyticus TaxID=1451 RepID=A0A1R1C573_PAEAM|nr:hypothetical protein [Paenibacillus amylolyticus]OMF17231.1 hypothetical protein BK131_04505 [Paenibacillus amylolyticus]